MKKNFIWIAVVAVVVIVAALTNPSEADHRDAVRAKLSAVMEQPPVEESSEPDGLESIGKGLGALMGNGIVDMIINNAVTRDNCILFSLTKFTFGNESKIVGVGIFGKVFLSSAFDKSVAPDI